MSQSADTDLPFDPDDRDTRPCPECGGPVLVDTESWLVERRTYCKHDDCRIHFIWG